MNTIKISPFYRLVTILLLLSWSSCQNDPSSHHADTPDVPKDALFQLLPASQTGINFMNKAEDGLKANINYYDYFYNGGGVAAGDINNDGLLDLLFTGNQAPNKLYLNKGNFQFEDISEKAGIADEEFWSTGATMVDINEDGWLDIYICHSGPKTVYSNLQNHLFINNGDLTFKEEAFQRGLVDNNHSNQATFFDYDKDGDLDAFIMNNADFIQRFRKIRDQVKKERAIQKYLQDPSGRKNQSNLFFRNDGKGQFTNVTEASGLFNWGYGLGVVASDLNNDGWTDIYVANDYYIPDFLYINNGDGTFQESNKERMGHNAQFGMGCDAADINNDGFLDVGVVDMVAGDRIRNKTLMPPMSEQRFLFITQGLQYQHQYMFNMLQLNNGDGTFKEIGQLAGITQTDWSWTSLFADFDLDGDKDYFITNGFRRDTRNRDQQAKNRKAIKEAMDNGTTAQELRSPEANLKRVQNMESHPQINYLFENKDGYQFKDVSNEWGFNIPSFSNGAIYADLDNDGDLDIVSNNLLTEAFVYQNKAADNKKGNFLNIKLVGESSNHNTYNTKVTLYYNDEIQYRESGTTRGYLSNVDPVLHFGLGNVSQVDKIKIEWLSGKQQILQQVDANQIITVKEADATETGQEKINPSPLFAQISPTSSGINFQHQENRFWDFQKEVLLPHRQSRNGPHLTVGDVNGDGREDFFVGAAKNKVGANLFTTIQW